MSMDGTNVLAFGASRNIGYHSAVRLLAQGANVTFLLRSTSIFDNDETINSYVASGKARLVTGDVLKAQDVEKAWSTAAEGGHGNVGFVLFTIGATQAKFSITQGAIIEPRNLSTQGLLNVLCTMPKYESNPKLILISSIGVTKAGHDNLPLLLKPFYSWILPIPHADKLAAERVLYHCGEKEWVGDEPSAELLNSPETTGRWFERAALPSRGEFKSWVIVRPALLLNGSCRADELAQKKDTKEPYKIVEGDGGTGYTISRQDVGHFLVEGVVKNWDKWEGKVLGISY